MHHHQQIARPLYPTNAHERRGKDVGLPADKVEAMLSGLPTSFSDTREQIVYEMATCLANARWVPKGLYDRAVEALGHVGITDVICLMGHYTSVSMTLAFYDVPAGAREWPARPSGASHTAVDDIEQSGAGRQPPPAVAGCRRN